VERVAHRRQLAPLSPDREALAAIGLSSILAAAGLTALLTALHYRRRLEPWAGPLRGRLSGIRIVVPRGQITIRLGWSDFRSLVLACPRFLARPKRMVIGPRRRWRRREDVPTGDAAFDGAVTVRVGDPAVRAMLLADASLRGILLDLVQRYRMRLRVTDGHLTCTLRPTEGRPLGLAEARLALDTVTNLHARLLAAGAVAFGPSPPASEVLRRTTIGLLVGVPLVTTIFVALGMAIGRMKWLAAGEPAAVAWHALLSGVPVGVLLGRLWTRMRPPRPGVEAGNLISGCLIAACLSFSLLVLVNEHLDGSPGRTVEVDLLEVHRDGEDPSFEVSSWHGGDRRDGFPLPGWFAEQLQPGTARVLLEVHDGAFGYEHVTAVGLPGR
jgi:hypothetical protein